MTEHDELSQRFLDFALDGKDDPGLAELLDEDERALAVAYRLLADLPTLAAALGASADARQRIEREAVARLSSLLEAASDRAADSAPIQASAQPTNVVSIDSARARRSRVFALAPAIAALAAAAVFLVIRAPEDPREKGMSDHQALNIDVSGDAVKTSDIIAALKRDERGLLACFKNGSARVTLDIALADDGVPSNVRRVDGDASVSACAEGELRRISWPIPDRAGSFTIVLEAKR